MPACWAALLANQPAPTSPRIDPGIAIWALQFTPRVAYLDESVVLEVEASMRLFGGEEALRERVSREARELGVSAVSWAPNSLAALALARCGVVHGFAEPLGRLMDRLPLASLSAVAAHEATLARLGCRTLGDVRRLPRGGVSRRFDKEVLAALDQAYGLRPTAHRWVTLPETFASRLELPSRVDSAGALLFGARRLLLQLCGWLAARNAGVTAIALRWWHDVMRAKTAGEGGELVVRTAEPTRNVDHLGRLLAEHLAKATLLAPVGDLELAALEVQSVVEESKSLLPDTLHGGEALDLVLERIAARLGSDRVLRPCIVEDHRLECMQSWIPAAEAGSGRAGGKATGIVDIPQPTWVLPQPLKLAVSQHRPLYQGPLQLVVGPHRVEGGWWHRVADIDGHQVAHNVQRDYWVAVSEHGGVLWVFQERLAHDDISWYLHGVFA